MPDFIGHACREVGKVIYNQKRSPYIIALIVSKATTIYLRGGNKHKCDYVIK